MRAVHFLSLAAAFLHVATAFVPASAFVSSGSAVKRPQPNRSKIRSLKPERSLVLPNAVPLPLEAGGASVASSLLVADLQETVIGFVNGGGLLAVPILGAFLIVGLIGGFIVWSAQPSVRDDEDD
mmetsp:Transcript_29481/g.59227  ORF Transcript_29481/g.59227 Transcript_29481/m.59227 type:complete len:125 (-) Transcript_29481:421-795(-)